MLVVNIPARDDIGTAMTVRFTDFDANEDMVEESGDEREDCGFGTRDPQPSPLDDVGPGLHVEE